MKILVTSHMYPRTGMPVNGIFIHESVKALRAQGIDVRVVSGDPFWINTYQRKLIKPALQYYRQMTCPGWDQWDTVPVIYFPYIVGSLVKPSFHAISYSKGLHRWIDTIQQSFPFDLVHAHTGFLDGTAATQIAKHYHVPSVITEHTGPFDLLTNTILKKLQTQRAFQQATKIFVVSKSLKQDITHQLKFRQHREISITPNGVNTDLFRPAPTSIPQTSTINAIWIGHHVPGKGIDRLIDAFHTVYDYYPQLRLMLIGDGPLLPQVEEDIRARNLHDAITLKPQADRESVAQHLQQSDFLVISSEKETFGVVAIEALSVGKPVLTTACGGPEDIIVNAELGEIVENSVMGLTEGLAQMCTRIKQFDQFAIRQHALANYAEEQLAVKMKREYEKLLLKKAANNPSKRMKILMMTADHLMIDRRILQEAKSLIQQGHEVTLLAGFECPQAETYQQEGINIHRFCFDWNDSRVATWIQRLKITAENRFYVPVWKSLQKIITAVTGFSSYEQFIYEKVQQFDFDILHVHDFPMLKIGIKAAKTNKVPLIYDAHELYYAQVQLPQKIQKKYRRQECKYIKKGNAVITVNPFIADIMEKQYRIKTPWVIFNACEKPQDNVGRNIRHELPLADTDKVVLYQGWISDNRGIDCVVRAASYFQPHIKLVLIGYGPFVDTLQQIVVERQLSDRVFFLGKVEPSEILSLTASADLGILPYFDVDLNNYYCSPNKLFEYIMAGIPFIANDLPFIRSINELYQVSHLGDLSSEEAIAEMVNHILSTEGHLQALKEKVAIAREHLNWHTEEKKLFEIYQTVYNEAGLR